MNRITRRTTLAAMTACAVALALPAAAQPQLQSVRCGRGAGRDGDRAVEAADGLSEGLYRIVAGSDACDADWCAGNVLASPKSRILTTPSGVMPMFAGLRSR